jgi:hypothetical protein
MAAAPNPTPKECIAKEIQTCQFVVKPNDTASGKEPIYEFSAFSEVNRHSAHIDKVAKETGVDARLIRAIMYMETTHGYYDMPLSWIGKNKSLLPMNVNVDYWGSAFGDRKTLEKPYENIKAGATILKRIMANLPKDPAIAQIATLYQNISATRISNYGARVQKIYDEQPWLKRGAGK